MRIYLDHNATTPLRDEVFEAMARALRELPGNPSSVHAEGAAARARVEAAREQVAGLLGAPVAGVIFTAGATEANNSAVFAAARADPARRHLVTTCIEHPSVEAPCAALEARGWAWTRVAVDGGGRVEAAAVEAALRPDTALVSVIWANNETGVVQPVEAIAERVRARGIPLHVDATQAVGKLPVDLERVPADLVSLSAHKLNGPKGVGALVVRDGSHWAPHLLGGPQERGRRGGTENVAGIVGLGVAAELAGRERVEGAARQAALRDRLWDGLRAKVPGLRRNGSESHVLPNTLNVCFEATAGELLLQLLDLEGIAVSAGAACASGSLEASPVLTAMGLTPEQARGSLRLSLGLGVDELQIERVLTVLPDLVRRAREAERA